jgi:hypothetical protein
MGLFDGYFDPQQFGEGGGLLARLRALQPQMGQDQAGVGFGQSPPITQSPPLQPTLWPNLSDAGQALFNPQPAAPNLTSQFQALRPVLGDHDAMAATVSPETGKTMIAQTPAEQQSDNNANVVQAGFRLGGIPFPFPPMPPVPPPPIPMPEIPDWMKAAGAILQLFRGNLSGKGFGGNRGGGGSKRRSGDDDDDDPCGERLGLETSRCYGRIEEYAHQDFLSGCTERAKGRWTSCLRNGGRPDPSEPPEWGPADEETWFNQNR